MKTRNLPVLTQAKAILDGRKFEELGMVYAFGNGLVEAYQTVEVLGASQDAINWQADAVILINFSGLSPSINGAYVTAFGMAIKYT